uniref:Major facilitator superfamily (MFS) profile domain-containing protein n=1 Tax=Opuntia streptacantha TaxID=393608 RepID=A0A7C9AFH7_OPUST
MYYPPGSWNSFLLLAEIVMPSLGWRWLLILSAIPSSFLLIFYSKTPESPRYLYMRGRTDDALQVLERIAIMNQTKLPSGILVSVRKAGEVTNSQSEDARLLSPTKDDSETLDSVGSNVQQGASVFTLLSPKLLRSTLLLWAVFFGNAFSYYGLVLLTTELSSGKNKCTTHQETGLADLSYRNVFITSFAEFPGKVIAAAMADRIGRKGSMSSMFFICCLFLLPLAFDQSEGLVTPLLFGARTCITATFTIVYIYAPEIYPTAVRTTGVGVASSMGRFGGMLCPLVAVTLVHGCHITASIFLFETVIFVSGVCVVLFPFETKGCELSDDVSELNQEVELA